jgi:hypothetical protein
MAVDNERLDYGEGKTVTPKRIETRPCDSAVLDDVQDYLRE